jgi:hypothetical protein
MTTPIVSLSANPSLLIETEGTVFNFNFQLSQAPPGGGVNVTVLGNAPQILSHFDQFNFTVSGGDTPVPDFFSTGFDFNITSQTASINIPIFDDDDTDPEFNGVRNFTFTLQPGPNYIVDSSSNQVAVTLVDDPSLVPPDPPIDPPINPPIDPPINPPIDPRPPLPPLPGILNTPFARIHDLARPGSYLFVAPPEAVTLNPPRYDNQGFAFAAAASPEADPLLRPFIRYVDTALGREGNYLYVAEPEAAFIDVNNPNFVKQGVAFYAYYGGQGSNTLNFHRFITPSGAHFFAADPETNSILGGLPASPGQIAPNGFTYEGVAFAAGG